MTGNHLKENATSLSRYLFFPSLELEKEERERGLDIDRR